MQLNCPSTCFVALAKTIKCNKYTQNNYEHVFPQIVPCAWCTFTFKIHNIWGSEWGGIFKEPLQRRCVALDILQPLELRSGPGSTSPSDTQQLKPADQSWWSEILVVSKYFLNVVTVVEIVCLE